MRTPADRENVRVKSCYSIEPASEIILGVLKYELMVFEVGQERKG